MPTPFHDTAKRGRKSSPAMCELPSALHPGVGKTTHLKRPIQPEREKSVLSVCVLFFQLLPLSMLVPVFTLTRPLSRCLFSACWFQCATRPTCCTRLLRQPIISTQKTSFRQFMRQSRATPRLDNRSILQNMHPIHRKQIHQLQVVCDDKHSFTR